MRYFAAAFAVSLALFSTPVMGEPDSDNFSALWGEDGEAWSPEGRLPDFSFAGYRRGEAAIPELPVKHNVRDFGAKGDGETDDTAAFQAALRTVASGAILIPEGRYVITDFLTIEKPNVVLRGEGPDKTTLYFPTPLNDIKPNWGSTTGGRRTSNYSWSGGFIRIRGDFQRTKLASITAPAKRGTYAVTVDDPAAFSAGQAVEIRQKDNADNSLAIHLYSGDPRISVEKINGRTQADMVSRITDIDGDTLTVDRPLRFDVEAQWNPAIFRFDPTVTDSGVEGIRFEFPNTPYEGHFTELGYNAFAIGGAAHCWVRNVHIHNADSGGFVSGPFNTIDGITFTSERERDSGRNSTGHHGVTLRNDSVCTNFDFRTKFVHDLTVSHSAGCVYSNGRGDNLSFDHHRRAPYANLFTNIHTGTGEEVWRSGGGRDLGAHCGARGTFWNIRADKPFDLPPENWGPWSMNFVGLHAEAPASTDPEAEARWNERIDPEALAPQNLHEAQLKRRLKDNGG